MKIGIIDRILILIGRLKICDYSDCVFNDREGVCHINQIWVGEPLKCDGNYELMNSIIENKDGNHEMSKL